MRAKSFCNGKALGDAFELVSAHVRLELNRIGKATLRFNAGDMDKQTLTTNPTLTVSSRALLSVSTQAN